MDSAFVDAWVYKGEGNANIVFAYAGTNPSLVRRIALQCCKRTQRCWRQRWCAPPAVPDHVCHHTHKKTHTRTRTHTGWEGPAAPQGAAQRRRRRGSQRRRAGQ